MARVGMLGRWEQGVFKQFLGMKKELFSGAQPDEMWFGVGNRAVRFGKKEFLLVTGLRFGPMPQSVNSLPKAIQGRVYHRYFGGSPTPLKDILSRLSGEEFDEPEDVMKLGYVYFVPYFAWSGVPWYCRKKPAHLENKFNDELEALTTLSPMQDERRQEYYRQFDPLAVVGPKLHKDGGYDLENEPSRRGRRGRALQASIDTEIRSKMNHDSFSCRQSFNELRSYIDSRFEQMDLKIDKLRSDFHGHSYAESSLCRDNLGDMNDAHDAHEDEVGDDQHDEAADEAHVG
ncbi:hypothetical protein Ddye_011506 [Dipteronia dyeriana]|uniref:DUF1985 domain-containing protein n=1 Tax=Dipteronia dyeriana TaxID=168575 RepID=A0AAD9X2P3_9ROSI|nr:hypothetical protein Ddye_011506 [Dipteronia dyeriana]